MPGNDYKAWKEAVTNTTYCFTQRKGECVLQRKAVPATGVMHGPEMQAEP